MAESRLKMWVCVCVGALAPRCKWIVLGGRRCAPQNTSSVYSLGYYLPLLLILALSLPLQPPRTRVFLDAQTLCLVREGDF